MLIKRLDHVQLSMPLGGEDLARQFYHGVLGIPETAKPAHLAKRGGCWFEHDGLKIHLGVESNFRPAKKAHPALVVEGLRAFDHHIRRLGYAVTEEESMNGYERIYIEDPFGDRLEMMEATGE